MDVDEEQYVDVREGGHGGRAILVPEVQTRFSGAATSGRNQSSIPREIVTMRLRACIGCRLVLNEDQFIAYGCPNCPDLELDGNREAISLHTTPHFEGLFAIMNPTQSRAALTHGLRNKVPGAYALRLPGLFGRSAPAPTDQDHEDEVEDEEV